LNSKNKESKVLLENLPQLFWWVTFQRT